MLLMNVLGEIRDLIQQLGSDQSLPWLIILDFEEIVFSFEKNSGRV